MNSPLDVRIEALLGGWAPALGRPTCGPGCDRCCRRMTVLMTSAEAVRLVEGLRARPDFEAVRGVIGRRIAALQRALPASPEQALNALLDLGPCVFLDNRNCGVHAHRPDGCRAAYVWHEAWYCGRPDYDQCVPAELIHARIDRALALTLEEMDAGRRPYWGQILPAVWVMLEHGEAYAAGADLAQWLDPMWIEAELVELPSREHVLAEHAAQARAFEQEDFPFGAPRGSECASREDLRAFGQ
ncbi:MAG: YkgJ family cysteine cluster protein [Acidobacteria bacterium]|nr:YkgJ family cysteine cluster protein [Acidobacteriota bacterium]